MRVGVVRLEIAVRGRVLKNVFAIFVKYTRETMEVINFHSAPHQITTMNATVNFKSTTSAESFYDPVRNVLFFLINVIMFTTSLFLLEPNNF